MCMDGDESELREGGCKYLRSVRICELCPPIMKA